MLVSSVRQRKDELEQRMSTLQESRRELMVQLEQLMMLLKVPQTRAFHLLNCSDAEYNKDSFIITEQNILFPVGNSEVLVWFHTVACILLLWQVVKQYGQMMNYPCATISPSCGRSLQLMYL